MASQRLLCIFVVTLSACGTWRSEVPPPTLTHTTGQPEPDALRRDYERSIRAAAVRDPSFVVDLRTIRPEQSHIRVANFTEWGSPASPTQRPLWVSLPDQLFALCHGKPDSVLAIEQALGLPPKAVPDTPTHQWQVVLFTVPRAALFRPCPGGTDIAAPRCSNTLAEAPTVPSARADTLDAVTARFLLDQIWSSDRIGFRTAPGTPDWGYPFTGMGWTYNWDPKAASPVGISEFVVRKDILLLSTPVAITPVQFCKN
jgi:hypothetical protein